MILKVLAVTIKSRHMKHCAIGVGGFYAERLKGKGKKGKQLIERGVLLFSRGPRRKEEMGNYSKNWGGCGGHISFSLKKHVVFWKS